MQGPKNHNEQIEEIRKNTQPPFQPTDYTGLKLDSNLANKIMEQNQELSEIKKESTNMPGSEKKDERKPNEYYGKLMEWANYWLKDGLGSAKYGRVGNAEYGKLYIDPALNSIARAIAFARLAEKYGYKPLSEIESEFSGSVSPIDPLSEEAKKLGKEIRNSDSFQTAMGSMSGQEICEFVGVRGEKKNEWNPRDYTEFGEKYNAKVKESLPEIAFRSRMKGLAGDLERSTHKSFAGKLKSFFVGNSDEYETALKAVKGLADGTADRRQAAIDIMGYLDIRKNKVRDHEYGRDRFDAMMKSLATVMEPEVFEAYCDSVDQARKQRDPGYKGKTDANAYLTDEGKRLLAEKKAETLRESDTNMIEKNAKNPAAAAEGVGCLDYLRKMENPTAKNLAWIDEQMHAHPEAREMARKIVLERKLNIEIPRTDVAKMDPETRKLLKEQEKRTQDLDRRQNPELYPKQPEAKSKGPEL